MPLLPGKSARVRNRNIRELISSKPGATRKKGIRTMAKRRGLSFGEAKRKQAVAMAYNKQMAGRMRKMMSN